MLVNKTENTAALLLDFMWLGFLVWGIFWKPFKQQDVLTWAVSSKCDWVCSQTVIMIKPRHRKEPESQEENAHTVVHFKKNTSSSLLCPKKNPQTPACCLFLNQIFSSKVFVRQKVWHYSSAAMLLHFLCVWRHLWTKGGANTVTTASCSRRS